MANRHLARTLALQSLFQWDFHGKKKGDLKPILRHNFEEFAPEFDDGGFAQELLERVAGHLPEIDKLITTYAPEWPLDQITLVDRNVLRLGIYELRYSKDIPPKVAINEAIELAKTFGGDSSGKFINGVLGSIYKEMVKKGEKQDMDAPLGVRQISAGGIIFYQKNNSKYYALVLDAHGRWTFPKGKISEGEDLRTAALREIREEIGLDNITLYDKVGEIEVVVNEPHKKPTPKTIHLFLGETEKQNFTITKEPEVKDAAWVKESEVIKRLGYDQAKSIFKRALEMQK